MRAPDAGCGVSESDAGPYEELREFPLSALRDLRDSLAAHRARHEEQLYQIDALISNRLESIRWRNYRARIDDMILDDSPRIQAWADRVKAIHAAERGLPIDEAALRLRPYQDRLLRLYTEGQTPEQAARAAFGMMMGAR